MNNSISSTPARSRRLPPLVEAGVSFEGLPMTETREIMVETLARLQADVKRLEEERNRYRDWLVAIRAADRDALIWCWANTALNDGKRIREAAPPASTITEAERLEFAAAEWEEYGPTGFRLIDPPDQVVASKTGPHGWWQVARYSDTADVMLESADLETAAECIRWAHDPDSVEPGDGPGICGFERKTEPAYGCGD